jgi:hypothetical protein
LVGSFVRVVQLHIHGGSRKKSLRYGKDGWFKNQSGSDKFSEPFLWHVGLNEESKRKEH